MKFLCRLTEHVAAPSHLTVDGLPFSRCRRCSVHMIRWRDDWIAIAKGERFLWQAPAAAGHRAAGETELPLPFVSSVQVSPRSAAR